MVPQLDGVGERLEAERVLAQARDRQRARDGAERDDDVLVGDLDELLVGLHPDAAGVRVERDGPAEDELRVRAHHPEGHDDVARLERPRRGLREDRGVEHEVLRADDRRAALAEQARHVAAGEPPAEDEGAAQSLPFRHRSYYRVDGDAGGRDR